MSLSQFSGDDDLEDVNVKYTLDKQKQKQKAILLLKVHFIQFIYLLDCNIYYMLVCIFNSSNNHQQSVNDGKRLCSSFNINVMSCTHKLHL